MKKVLGKLMAAVTTVMLLMGTPAAAQIAYTSSQMTAAGVIVYKGDRVVTVFTPSGYAYVPLQGTRFSTNGQMVSNPNALRVGEPIVCVTYGNYIADNAHRPQRAYRGEDGDGGTTWEYRPGMYDGGIQDSNNVWQNHVH